MAPRKKFIVRKFNKEVDSGPLPEGLDQATAQTLQDERIRRQMSADMYIPPKPPKKVK